MSTTTTTAFEDAVRQIQRGESLETAVEALLAQLTPEEKLWLLDGDQEFWPAIAEMSQAYNARPIIMGAVERLGIPGLRFSDGPRGVVMGASTAFPFAL